MFTKSVIVFPRADIYLSKVFTARPTYGGKEYETFPTFKLWNYVHFCTGGLKLERNKNVAKCTDIQRRFGTYLANYSRDQLSHIANPRRERGGGENESRSINLSALTVAIPSYTVESSPLYLFKQKVNKPSFTFNRLEEAPLLIPRDI